MTKARARFRLGPRHAKIAARELPMYPRLFTAAAFCLIAVASSKAEEDSHAIFRRTEAPKEVRAAVTCDEADDIITRDAFAGGWLWQSKCPSNHANFIKAQIFSRDKNGKDAKLIRFPVPRGTPLDEISNVEFFPTTREFNSLFVNPEDAAVCRTEARWIAQNPLKPKLVFWRETKDCDGKKGWRVLKGKK